MKNVFYLFCILWWWIFASGAHAAVIKDLYEAEVPVADQSAGQRDAALQAALLQVMARVSGQRQFSEPAKAVAGQRAPALVQQFRYRVGEGAPGQGGELPRYQLWVQFGESPVNQLLHELGLPVWGSVRPSTLVWLVVEEQGSRTVVGGEDGADWQTLLHQAAKERGVPLILPLRDLEDQRRLNVVDLWGGFQERINEASRRYRSDKVLVGRVYASGQRWTGRWTLFDSSESQSWESSGADAAGLVTEAINNMTDMLAAQYARVVDPSRVNAVRLQITGVGGLKAYARVMQYLSSLGNVKQVSVREVHGDSLVVELAVVGDPYHLSQLITLGHVLELQPKVFGASGQPEFNYLLLP